MLRIERRGLLAVAASSFFSSLFGGAKAEGRSFADIAELREAVMGAVRAQPGVDSVVADPTDVAKFRTTIGDWWSTSDVTNLFNYLKANPREETKAVIARFTNSIAEARASVVEEENIVAVIRTRDYLVDAAGAGLDVLHEPLGADLMVIYMVDNPDSIATLKSQDLPGKDLADVRRIALRNLERWLPKVEADNEVGAGVLYYVDENPMLSTGLVLLDGFWKSIAARFPGDVLIALPRKDQLFVFDDGGAQARARVRGLIDATFEDEFNLLSPVLYARRNGKIVAVSE